MDRKHGKYVVNVEQSENQPSITCPNDQEVHSSACWRPHSSDITCDISPNSTGVCVGPGVVGHSGYQHTESAQTQVKGNCCNNWTLWNIFLACFLACVITTAIGVLIICLVNNRGNDNTSIIIKLSSDNGESVTAMQGKTSAGPQSIVTTMSTESTTVATSTDSTTISTSTESTATIATTPTSTAPTTSTHLTELTTTTAITPTSTKTTDTST